ncbi:hypothetical protein [Saccharicrinis aurantiacus]|uniref:hypothetical protein n=1 Tax=Saccharicrinis aurantiacus TaxID=1849719 RepID=UPI0024920D38|nr:hypothetical protein [Saccharicrinis aurantiacus]
MRKFLSVLAIMCIAISINAQSAKDEVIAEFVKGAVSFEAAELSKNSPISSFNKKASEQASKSIVLTKENVKESLNEAKTYSSCFITVGVHTIVKVTDFEKTIMSGSWGTEMPFGEGYIQKGELVNKQDYINNIIGIPDTQRRMMFLFK